MNQTPGDSGYGLYQPPPVPPRRHRGRSAVLITGTVLAGAAITGVALGVSSGPGHPAAAPVTTFSPASTSPAVAAPVSVTDPSGQACTALDAAGWCPGDDPAAPATKVTFVVTGTGDPSITYGSSSDNRDGGGTLGTLGDGNGLPWTRSLPFDGNAQYYSLNAQLEGSGDIACKIVVSGPGDTPLTVSSGHASGGYNICSAQAAPSDSTGTSWQNEN